MGAATRLRRRLDWSDTDAAGHWHFATVFRLAEAAEAQLHRELGIADRMFGSTPRVHVEGEFHAPVFFDEELEVTLRVDGVGRTALTYVAEIRRVGAPAADVVATARIVTVFVADGGRPTPWPDDLAAVLRGRG